MPASQATFKEYEFNIDISDLIGDGALDEERFKNSYKMLKLEQLNDTIPILKTSYNDLLVSRAESISVISNAKELHPYPDSLRVAYLDATSILSNFTLNDKIGILNDCQSKNE